MGLVDDMDNHKVSFPPFILCLKCPPDSENIVVNNSEFSHNFLIFKTHFLKKRFSNFIWIKFPFKLMRVLIHVLRTLDSVACPPMICKCRLNSLNSLNMFPE